MKHACSTVINACILLHTFMILCADLASFETLKWVLREFRFDRSSKLPFSTFQGHRDRDLMKFYELFVLN